MMRRVYTLATAILLILATLAAAQAAPCAPDRVDLRGDFGQMSFRVELALTGEDRARGLMFREAMPTLSGMLFIYPRAQELAFWMRNTLIPLDLLFVDAQGKVVKIHSDAIPLDETPMRSDAPALAVLEINGGLARRFGLKPGDLLRHPSMPQNNAHWPCD